MYTLDVKAGNAMGGCRGGRARAGHRPPMEKNCLAILWAFLLLFLHMGAFLLRFSHLPGGGGGWLFHHVGAFLLLFTSWWGPILGLPLPYENFCERPWAMQLLLLFC